MLLDTLAPTFDGLIQVTVLPPRILDAVLKLVYVSFILLLPYRGQIRF